MSHNALKLLAGEQPKKEKKSKYGNKKIKVGDIVYASKNEYRRECELKLQERAGIIKDLQRQVEFSIDVNDMHVCKYVADWTYAIVKTNARVVEDFKGVETDTFKLKSKLMKACHGIDVWANRKVNAHCGLEYPQS